jgi:ribonuclease HI
MLDDVFQRVVDKEGCRCGAGLRLFSWGTYEICGPPYFPTSNNVAEYEALINGFHIAIELASDG